MQDSPTPTREELFREKAANYPVCHSQDCPIKEHFLSFILKDYVPESLPAHMCINLRNPQMQRPDCPQYRQSEPVRMPLGLSQMYHDMPGHMERAVKNHLIHLFSRKRYYQYHNGQRPVTPAEEQIIRQTLLAAGWTQEPVFNDYVEEYLW